MLNPDPQSFETEPADPAPQVFTRAFSTPAGLPWVQARAAQLEARHGAPLPIAELMHQVRRVGAWAPGAPARFVVFYIRAREFRGPFETETQVDGRTVKAAFGAAGRQAAQLGRIVAPVLAGAAALTVLVIGVGLALHSRSDVEDRLVLADQRLSGKSHAARNLQRQADQARAVARAVGQARPMSEVLADLSWASATRTPEARITAIHWDHGLLAVEVRGETAPFGPGGRDVERAPKPLRPGVWLWGVRPAGAAPNLETGP